MDICIFMMGNKITKYNPINRVGYKVGTQENKLTIFGLFHRDISGDEEQILGISYNIDILNKFVSDYLDTDDEIYNPYIRQIDLLLLSKISLWGEMKLFCKCCNQIENKFNLSKIDIIKKDIKNKFYYFGLFENGFNKNYLIVVDCKKINYSNLRKMIKYFKGNMSSHEIILDKFYPDSIKVNDYYSELIDITK